MNEGDAVEGAKGVVAHGDERAFGQVVEHLLVVDAQRVVKLVEKQTAHKVGTRGVAAVAVDAIHFVDRQEAKQTVDEPFMAFEGGHHLSEVVVIEHVGTYLVF